MQPWSFLLVQTNTNCKETKFLLSLAEEHQMERLKMPIGHFYTFWIFYDDVGRSSQNVREKWVKSIPEIRVGKFLKSTAILERFSSAENMHNSTAWCLKGCTMVVSWLKKLSIHAESKPFRTFRPETHCTQKAFRFLSQLFNLKFSVPWQNKSPINYYWVWDESCFPEKF